MPFGPTNLPGLNAFLALQSAMPQNGGAPGGSPPQQQPAPQQQQPQGIDIAGAFRTGEQAARQDGGGAQGYARGGAVKGYAFGGGVSGGDIDSGDSSGLGGLHPMLMDLTRNEITGGDGSAGGQLTGEDKGLALAQAGFAMAAGTSPHALTNIGEGATYGLNALQKLKQERALQRMRDAQMMQMAAYRQDQLQNTAELRKIQTQREADLAQHQINEDAAKKLPDWVPGGVTADGKVVLYNKKDASQTKIIDAGVKGASQPVPDLPPEQLRKVLPAAEVKTADAIIEGRLLPPNAGNKGAAAQRLLQVVTSLDPTFDATNSATRFNTAKFFAPSGLGGQAVNSANTLVGHFGNLDKHIDELGNTDWATAGNTIKNFVDTHTGKIDPKTTAAIGKYNADVDVATRELQRLLTRTGGTGEEAQELRSRLANAKTPTELHAVVQEYVELMDSRMGALADQKTKGMGKDTNVWTDFYNQRSRDALKKISPDYAKNYESPPDVSAADAVPPVAANPAPAPTAAPRKTVQQNGWLYDAETHAPIGPASGVE